MKVRGETGEGLCGKSRQCTRSEVAESSLMQQAVNGRSV